MEENNADIGILTFHCADNFGAMLQAYGLKKYLCDKGMQAEVIRYEPFFMTGRHWFIPYTPREDKTGRKWYGWILRDALGGMKTNLERWGIFRKRRFHMRKFRENYLIDRKRHKILFPGGMKYLPYTYYIVGSDQIWNPEITCGLREVYFGAFRNRKKKRVIAYGASMGGTGLGSRYDEEFSRLIQYLDVVSLREEAAIPYLKRFYERDVTAVLDPVFLPGRDAFRKIEKKPGRKHYILVYITERNRDLAEYVQKLSREKGLAGIELCTSWLTAEAGFEVDFTAGPAEFLGYIDEADYVVSNSFHVVAFSIIFRKKFLAFVHSSRGTRIRNILQIHGLGDRLCGHGADIDAFVDWKDVERKTEEKVREAKAFLLENVTGQHGGREESRE